MPYSSVEGKEFTKAYFADKEIKSVLDIGPGSGTYRKLLDPEGAASWTGVEIWAPYISMFNLNLMYDKVIVADAFYVDWSLLGYPDLTILGDVLEHMPIHQAQAVLAKAVHHSKYVVLSIPIIDYPQGAELGNHWETHVTSWSDQSVRDHLLDKYEILAYDTGDVVGTYVIGGTQR